MAFLETPRFPDAISYGATGGPAYLTDVVVMAGGHEQRNAVWGQARAAYDVAHAARRPADFAAVRAFFHVVRGRLDGFRFKDWSDFAVASGEGVLTVITTDTTWQMYRRYTSGASTFDRKIQKPVSGTLAFTGGGTYTVDYTTGIVTKTGGANPTGWSGQFDVPCRFDVDALAADVISRSGSDLIVGWQGIRIIELRL